MSNEKSTSIVTENLLEMQVCIDSGDRRGFLELIKERRCQISNCSVGDNYLQSQAMKVYAAALEKFL